MPLTPADVHNVAFKKPPIGKRGYDEDEVDAFLDEVERELARLIEENTDLKEQVERAQRSRPPVGATAGTAAGTAEADQDKARLGQENAELRQQLERCQGELRQAQSRPAAEPVPAVSAQGEGERALSVLMTAQRTANEHVADAKREADKTLTDARGKAEELTRDARTKADALEREARQRHQEAMGSLEVKRAALQKHIEELKAFEREYRTRLKAYLEGQLRDLDGRGQAIESDFNRPPQPAAAATGPASPGGGGQPAGGAAPGSSPFGTGPRPAGQPEPGHGLGSGGDGAGR
jgi:DivIVA domain-containing protein